MAAGTSGAQSVERALAVLRTLASASDDLGVSELAARTGLTVSTTHRLLQALRADGIVDQDGRTHRYHLGAALVALGRRAEVVLGGLDVRGDGGAQHAADRRQKRVAISSAE